MNAIVNGLVAIGRVPVFMIWIQANVTLKNINVQGLSSKGTQAGRISDLGPYLNP
ncbi:hypothetical protein HR060_09565 [Catenovulum sp. SM1970]|uniref:hypothetical protein n=1 Tax=Marinifaba aquimaris TaxID=2741323 RepID=UPI001574AAD7|nr:hypothetical protein [Marinifaba aquimaris]NTS77120.1 hypothetical protein [Marinifaba aquimaris]